MESETGVENDVSRKALEKSQGKFSDVRAPTRVIALSLVSFVSLVFLVSLDSLGSLVFEKSEWRIR